MELQLDNLRAFLHVAEAGSFTRGAAQLGVPKARVSQQVRRLEHALGCRLLHRTTRAVRCSPDGERVLARARSLLDAAQELQTLFAGDAALRGRVRVDLPVRLARRVVIPRLPELLARHPGLELQLSSTDRLVDIVGEGFDAVVRVASLRDSSLVATRLGALPMISCASAAYLRARGTPRTVAELDDHVLVHYAADLGADVPTFEYRERGRTRSRPMRAAVTVNSADAYAAACLAGLGIIQAPHDGLATALQRGELVEILPRLRPAPLPVSLLHPHGRSVPRRVRVVLDWLAALLRAHLDRHAPPLPATPRATRSARRAPARSTRG
ncbi:MAG: LysR family transcriptional regulator [Nannocystaceae bacterium]|nr:LysR family transcriptional regulator [Nannocystaceae bacterium]